MLTQCSGEEWKEHYSIYTAPLTGEYFIVFDLKEYYRTAQRKTRTNNILERFLKN